MRTYYPYSGTRGGTTSRSTYSCPGRKTSSRRSLLLRSPLRLGRCLGQEPQLVAVSICLFFFLVVDTGKTQPDDVFWLVVRGLLVPAYPGASKTRICFFFLLSLSSGEGVYLSAQLWQISSNAIHRNERNPLVDKISPTTEQQCGMDFLVWWI